MDPARTDAIVADLVRKGFGHVPEPGATEVSIDTTVSRAAYVAMFGPTVGDRVRLGDTALWIQVERDMVGSPNQKDMRRANISVLDSLW